jgi:hypothetical protein
MMKNSIYSARERRPSHGQYDDSGDGAGADQGSQQAVALMVCRVSELEFNGLAFVISP